MWDLNFGELLPNGRDRNEMSGGLNEILFKLKERSIFDDGNMAKSR